MKALTPESDLQLPRADSIALHLIEDWLAERLRRASGTKTRKVFGARY